MKNNCTVCNAKLPKVKENETPFQYCSLDCLLKDKQKENKEICYECKNYNHVDCVLRKKKSQKKCSCWCNAKSSKYVNIFPKYKKIRRFKND